MNGSSSLHLTDLDAHDGVMVAGALDVLHGVKMGGRFDRPGDLSAWLDHPDRSGWVVLAGGEVVSGALAHHVDEEEARALNARWSAVPGGPTVDVGDGYVTAVATAVEYRGRGHLRALLAAELDWFDQRRTRSVITLCWRHQEATSFSGLTRAGFDHIADVDNYWPGFADRASFMRRRSDRAT